MPNVTLSVPEDLHEKIKRHPEVRWSEVIRHVLAQKIRDLEFMDRVTAKSALTAGDVDAFDHALKEALLRKYRPKASR